LRLMEKPGKCLVVIRVRGVSDVYKEISETLKLLNLTRNCHAVLIDDRPAYLGMLKKARDYITWGEISEDNLLALLKSRGRLIGDKKLNDEYAKKLGYSGLEGLAKALYTLKIEYKSLPGVKPVFRLHPPSKGFRGKIKRDFTVGGVTGYRGAAINDLLKRMM